jgi:hypothetical protein
MRAREAGVALALIALAACGKYGEPSRTRPSATAPRSAAEQAPSLAPADGSGEMSGSGEISGNDEECPPDAQQSDEKARKP